MNDETFDSYDVTFVFDYATITTTVFALHRDVAPAMAADQLHQDLGVSYELLATAEDVAVSLLDRNVL